MPTETWLVEVGQSPITGKWHARIKDPGGSEVLHSPPCDTEAEAIVHREKALEALKRQLGDKVLGVSRVN
jgi:hypothetical protein